MAQMRARILSSALAISLFLPAAAQAAPSFDPLYNDHAVLQRDKPLVVSGRADPGEAVTVTLAGATAAATAGADGRWQVSLPMQSAGGPFVLRRSHSRRGEGQRRADRRCLAVFGPVEPWSSRWRRPAARKA